MYLNIPLPDRVKFWSEFLLRRTKKSFTENLPADRLPTQPTAYTQSVVYITCLYIYENVLRSYLWGDFYLSK